MDDTEIPRDALRRIAKDNLDLLKERDDLRAERDAANARAERLERDAAIGAVVWRAVARRCAARVPRGTGLGAGGFA